MLKDLDIEVNNKSFSIPYVNFGAQNNLEVGDNVRAVGHPVGGLFGHMQGYVSQIKKDHEWSYNKKWTLKADVIQTQTPISPGNSVDL